jgi:hypothetical protein
MQSDRLVRLPTIMIWLTLVSLTPPALGRDGDRLWYNGPVPVVENSQTATRHHRLVTDGAGGVIVTWQRQPLGGIRAQRLDDSGIQRWLPADGVVLSDTGFHPAISATQTGGAVVAWGEKAGAENGIYVQLVDADGTPRWTPGGVKVSSSSSRPTVHADAGGGAYVAWRDAATATGRVVYINRYGVAEETGAEHASLGARFASPGDALIVSRGFDGAVVIWADDESPGRILAQSFGVDPEWDRAPPRVVADEPGRTMRLLDTAGDGLGGALVAWILHGSKDRVRVQRLDADGETVWTRAGVDVGASSRTGGDPAPRAPGISARVAPDGEGGAIVAWTDRRTARAGTAPDSIYLQRLDASGEPRWNAGGLLVAGDAALTRTSPRVAGDGEGGVIVVYERDVSGPAGEPQETEVAVARFDRNGIERWRESAHGDAANHPSRDSRAPQIVFDGSGPFAPGAIVVWRHEESGGLYAQKFEITSPVNDSCAQATEVYPGSHGGTLVGGTLDGSSSCGGEIADVWYRVVAPGDGTLLVDTCGTNDIGGVDGGVDTVLSLHSACPDAGGSYELTCNDDWPGSADSQACNGIDVGGFFGDSYVEKAVVLGEAVLVRVSRYPDEIDGPFQLRVGFVPAPGANDDCRNAAEISEGAFLGTLVGATADGEASCSDPPGPDLWYRFTAAGSGTLFVDSCGSNDLPGEDAGVDTVLSIHSACPLGPNSNEIPGACNDDWFFGNDPTACEGIDLGADLDSALFLDVAAAQSYWIRVSSYPGSLEGEFRLNVNALFDPAGRVPDGSAVPGNPLRVTKLVGGGLRLGWDPSCMTSDNDFAVYSGTLGDYSSHQFVTCATGGVLQWDLAPEIGDRYFLVVPHNGVKEGSYGFARGSDGGLAERPPAVINACFPQTTGSCP